MSKFQNFKISKQKFTGDSVMHSGCVSLQQRNYFYFLFSILNYQTFLYWIEQLHFSSLFQIIGSLSEAKGIPVNILVLELDKIYKHYLFYSISSWIDSINVVIKMIGNIFRNVMHMKRCFITSLLNYYYLIIADTTTCH